MYNNPTTPAHLQLLKSATDVRCERCESEFFESLFVVKKISAIVSPTAEEMLIPIQVLVCQKCKEVLQRADLPTKQSNF